MVCATLVSGLAPLKVLRYLRYSAAHASSSKQHRNVSLILCLLTCFSGGVFLATCFLHLFPELVENVRNLDELYGFHVDYPISELLSCAGFFLLFFLEEVVIMAIPSLAHSHGHGEHGHGFSLDESSLLTKTDAGGCCMTGTYIPPPQPSTEANEHSSKF
ncbi:hypothetical protein OESDEN_16442 [Oesophagostomum dentatum]|uniref:Metal cation transporter, ZIP family n=1 Tax=Oesophagostomum dentatum TaxID=61180 RepID=A0A0B1SEV4_OESDE|nr:hypothetical protein OESDEN_16442 [Oesophagostomum dentatum]